MIEIDPATLHRPHIGASYNKGIKGKKVAIVGYSHWSDDEDDDVGSTEKCITKVISGDWHDLRFFNSIASYFKLENSELWPKVAFFNFLPLMVGNGDARYDAGSPELQAAGKARAMRIMEELEPDMVMVFSRKGWDKLPGSLEDGLNLPGAQVIEGQDFRRQHYRLASGHVVQAFGLRHPMLAEKAEMVKAVAAALHMVPDPPE